MDAQVETRSSLGVMRSIQAKLLVMLAVLSLPLLVVSLLQLDRYQRGMNEQAGAVARAESRAAVIALEAWLAAHTDVSDASDLTAEQSEDLYATMLRRVPLEVGARLVVRDARGRVVVPRESDAAFDLLSADGDEQIWTDGKRRTTSTSDAANANWSVAVGLPPLEETTGGRATMLLASVWALALAASILIGVWAVSRFTTPLRRLSQAARRFGDGQLTERAVVETRDEVGTLAETFNSMAETLEARFAELEAQSRFINEVLDNLPLGVAVLDDRLAVRRANSKFKFHVGRTGGELKGRGLYEAAAGLARLHEVVEDVRRNRQPFVSYGLPLELVPRIEDAADAAATIKTSETYWDVIIYPASVRGNHTTEAGRGDLLLILNEVSDRVRAEKLASMAFSAERARSAELASVINQMGDGVLIAYARGRYRINPAAATMLGREPGEYRDGAAGMMSGITLYDMNDRRLDTNEMPLRRALDRGARVVGERYKIRRRSENSATGEVEERVIAISATPLAGDGDASRAGVVAVFRDITDEVRQHDELVAAYDRLREHDRLKSAFVANISHELRTPLNVILGLCQLMERDRRTPLTGDQADAVARMDRNARSLLSLVNNLLDYSRLEAGRAALRIEIVDVAEITREAVERIDDEARAKGVRLEVEIADDLKPISTDRQKLAQVLENLIGNGIKFTEAGEVRVRIAAHNRDCWMLEVSDTGKGMSEQEQAVIFDEFRQVDDRLTRRFGGAGLGLAITRKIIELLGGEITVESAPDLGSRFRVLWTYAPPQRTGTGSLLDPEILRERLTLTG